GLTLATPPAFAQWAGSVVSAADGAPIAGAIVRVEAGESVFTDADGAFLLPGPIADDAKIVAGAKGYYYAALSAPADGLWSFQLEPVPHDPEAGLGFQEPAECSSCHQTQWLEWQGSPMAHAGTNAWVLDLYSGEGTPGGMGG